MGSNGYAVGIDLGTTNSCVAVFKDGDAVVIPNKEDDRTVPSVVRITKDGVRLVGKPAKEMQIKHLKNTIYESKRLIGRKFDEQCIQDRMRQWPFKVIDCDGTPKIRIPQSNKTRKEFFPEEISGMILGKMREIAEAYLKCIVTKAVITVPAYFNDSQRQATIDAAKMAGLEVLKIMNEPTAAAFAYILKNGLANLSGNTLVFDLGGGTFDVSIINTNGKKFRVIAVNGDPDLGGADFDILIYNEIVNIMQRQVGERINLKPEQTQRIKAQCIRVKEHLSTVTSAQFEMPLILPDFDFYYTFTREAFEQLIRHPVNKIISTVKATLMDAKMSINDIDNIVLVGGSSKIPIIRKYLRDYFKKDLSMAINPDEAVALGAAYQAAILSNNSDAMIRNVTVVDVTPFSLGIEAEGANMDVIIKKNTPLPATFTKKYTTVESGQTALRIIVYQGEDKLTSNNTELGYFDLVGIPPAPARVPRIEVTFDVNTNGVLHVTATETSSKTSKRIEILTNTGRISQTDFVRIEKENKEYQRKQQFAEKAVEEKNALLRLCFEAKRTVAKANSANDEEKGHFISYADGLIDYLENLTINESNYDDFLVRKDTLHRRYYNLMTPL